MKSDAGAAPAAISEPPPAVEEPTRGLANALIIVEGFRTLLDDNQIRLRDKVVKQACIRLIDLNRPRAYTYRKSSNIKMYFPLELLGYRVHVPLPQRKS